MKQTYIIQENGQVTLPFEWREKHNLKKGDIVSFVETEQGLVVIPRVAVAMALLDEIARELKKQGVTFEQLMADSQQVRQEIYEERYGSKDA